MTTFYRLLYPIGFTPFPKIKFQNLESILHDRSFELDGETIQLNSVSGVELLGGMETEDQESLDKHWAIHHNRLVPLLNQSIYPQGFLENLNTDSRKFGGKKKFMSCYEIKRPNGIMDLVQFRSTDKSNRKNELFAGVGFKGLRMGLILMEMGSGALMLELGPVESEKAEALANGLKMDDHRMWRNHDDNDLEREQYLVNQISKSSPSHLEMRFGL